MNRLRDFEGRTKRVTRSAGGDDRQDSISRPDDSPRPTTIPALLFTVTVGSVADLPSNCLEFSSAVTSTVNVPELELSSLDEPNDASIQHLYVVDEPRLMCMAAPT